jgi:PRTRC genetic system protein B
MTNIDINLGQQSRFVLREAILLYKDEGQTFATVHEVAGSPPKLEPGRLLTLESLRELHRQLYGDASLEVLPEHVLAVSAHKLVWFEKPSKRVMFFQTSDACLQTLSGRTFHQPALLFVASPRSLNVYALPSAKRPVSSTALYTAPYYNTSRANVCLGSTELPASLSVKHTAAYSRAFFASAFTHGTSERLLHSWGGTYGEFWRFVQSQKAFPTQYLVPFSGTLEEVVCQRTR